MAKAAGLAGAMIANNIIALGATIVFARQLTDYGSLGALISYLLILTVVGQAMQVATAREGVLGHLGRGEALIGTVRRWTWSLLAVTAALSVLSVLLRQPIASAVGVHRYPWAAAIGIPAGCLYLEVCLLRGALQGVGNYKGVGYSLIGEQAVRLVAGAVLAIGLSVTGAYLGSLISYIDLRGLKRLREEGRIADGMLPKTKAIEDAIRGGVRRVHVVSYNAPEGILGEVFTNEGTGTMIVAHVNALTPAEAHNTP